MRVTILIYLGIMVAFINQYLGNQEASINFSEDINLKVEAGRQVKCGGKNET